MHWAAVFSLAAFPWILGRPETARQLVLEAHRSAAESGNVSIMRRIAILCQVSIVLVAFGSPYRDVIAFGFQFRMFLLHLVCQLL